MFSTVISAYEFGGLKIEIEFDCDEMTDARFASSGNPLPDSMYRRLQRNELDRMSIVDAIEEARYEYH